MYMKSSEGDPNKVLIAYSLIYMLPLSAKIPFNWRELTPVSVVALDQFVLLDNVAGPKTVKEFIAAAKAASSPFKMGGTGSKREDNVLTVFMEQKTGAKFSYLPYKSGGEAATQLVGNHTDSNVNNPSENLEVWRAGQVRALCVFDKERISYKAKVTETQSWNDIPTCKEEGLDVQYLMLRAMFLPGKVTAAQQAVYVDLFQKVTQTAEYKDYLEKQALKPILLTGKDMVQLLEDDDRPDASRMNQAGFVARYGRGDLQIPDRQDRRIGRMRVDHGVDLGPGPQDIEMKPPLARRALGGIVRAVEAHEHDLLGLHRLVGHAGRRDQQAAVMAQADI